MLCYFVLNSNLPAGRTSGGTTGAGKGIGMKLGNTKKMNQFLESLKAEGEVIMEDFQPCSLQSRSSPLPPSDPVTVAVEEKLNVAVKRDGGVNNFDVQGTLALQVLNDADGLILLQVIFLYLLTLFLYCCHIWEICTLKQNKTT